MSLTAPAPVEPPVLTAGATLAPGYRVVAHVSRGNALDVYEVFCEALLCHGVAKTVRPDRVGVTRVRDRLLLEGELLSRLRHPHLARALDTTQDRDGVPVVVLELVAGPTLEEIIDTRARRLPARDLAHLGRHLASALHYLHGAGYLHLDVRPANVVARAGVATLIDLSIARPPGPIHRGLGSREYLAPEQATGGAAGTATDVWGLGATLFEAATGVAPYLPLGAADQAAWEAGEFLQLRRPAPCPVDLGRRLPRDLADLIRAMLTPAPQGRPGILEVHDRLGRLV